MSSQFFALRFQLRRAFGYRRLGMPGALRFALVLRVGSEVPRGAYNAARRQIRSPPRLIDNELFNAPLVVAQALFEELA